jgi:hypothetical protein
LVVFFLLRLDRRRGGSRLVRSLPFHGGLPAGSIVAILGGFSERVDPRWREISHDHSIFSNEN